MLQLVLETMYENKGINNFKKEQMPTCKLTK